MTEIYSHAKNVCVDLGEEQDNSADAIQFMREILELDRFGYLIRDRTTTEKWESLSKLITRPWFGRRWIVQEIALARKASIHCGMHDIDWHDFKDSVALFVSASSEVSQLFKKSDEHGNIPDYFGYLKALGANRLVEATTNVFRKRDDGTIQERLQTIEWLVSNLTQFEAREEHDIIYAVLSLAMDTTSTAEADKTTQKPERRGQDIEGNITVTGAKPSEKLSANTVRGLGESLARSRAKIQTRTYIIDYNQDFFDVCKFFVNLVIETSRSLDILCRPWCPNKTNDKLPLPSWLPRLSRRSFTKQRDGGQFERLHADPLTELSARRRSTYNASLNTAPRFEIGEGASLRSIFVTGFVLDVVVDIESEAQAGVIPNEWAALAGWVNYASPPPDHFWRTLVADRGPDGENAPGYCSRACHYVFRKAGEDAGINTGKIKDYGQELLAKFGDRVHSTVFMRKLFKTKRKFLGLATKPPKDPVTREDTGAVKNDLIVILYGCSVPVLLRGPLSDGESQYYRMIGECFVHGMMDGEALRIRDAENVKAQKFELR
ncbi:MAG: hypothetical protein Q9160_006347 [Pyrenula sp. 1 TL-2023]